MFSRRQVHIGGMTRACALVVMVAGVLVSSPGEAQTPRAISPLRAGAAKVDVTPSESELPKDGFGVLDHLYARAIVLDNGAAAAALVTVDAIAIPDALWQTVSQQIEKDLGIPATHVLLTATHTHSPGGQRGPDYPQKIVEAVRLAEATARAGPSWLRDRAKVMHQREPADHRSEDQPVVGRAEPAKAHPDRPDGGRGEVRNDDR